MKKITDLLDNLSRTLTVLEKRRDADMAMLYKLEVELLNIVETDIKRKNKKKSRSKAK
jgi:hypothetical protein